MGEGPREGPLPPYVGDPRSFSPRLNARCRPSRIGDLGSTSRSPAPLRLLVVEALAL